MNTPPDGILALPNGQWVLEHDSHLSRWAEQHGQIITDPLVFKFLKPHLKDVKVVWDLGAAIGDHTRQYLDWGMQVYAFEPNPISFTCLEHNCPEAECLPYAASDKDGSLNFSLLENAGASRVTKDGEWSVEAKRLDGLGLPDPDFVKIDIEGHEVLALHGMAEMLERRKPIVFIEVNAGALDSQGFKPGHITDFFYDVGYGNKAFVYPMNCGFSSPQFDLLLLPP